MRTLGIFLKRPVAGLIKTRLGNEIGMEQAARLATAFQLDLLHMTKGIAERRVAAYTPDEPAAREEFAAATGTNDLLWPQPDRPLGERLIAFFNDWCCNQSPVVVIGGDSPTLPVDLIHKAFEALVDHDCVIGPALDGGYYLIGMKQPHPQLFQEIPWSSPEVLRQSCVQAARGGLSLALLPPWYDIDDLHGLQFLNSHVRSLEISGKGAEIPLQTARALKELFPNDLLGRNREHAPGILSRHDGCGPPHADAADDQ